ncbi:ubiquitin carboxyl-terminal hydrolase 5 isoform X1 [Phalaenopsis equestris]|uniref:ubiquitin carboxyl-terminal hydrolase 5 isoform X1 n=1 Tax=Phalaenopsis equestris TaxID=78828 RepID=UPI0009E5B8E3|nr:ubiquitin carboxyl-terminal hydrolase 5 isoform X1 [Phalaenopsis equestris]XP_020575009.1 ubiquitin carboxyl-terminal hydrolase 5 isoform X1 [Phalaenopsis equestris]
MNFMAVAPVLTPEEERTLIRDISAAAEAQTKEGDNFYLITSRWWQSWLDFVNQDTNTTLSNGYGLHNHGSPCSSIPKRPLAIDNSDLINDATSEIPNVDIELHETLVEGRDYILLPQEVWNRFRGWYGGGPTLPRKTINSGSSQTDLYVEVYPLRLQLLLTPKKEQAIIRISKKETVRELHRKACEVFDLILDNVCIWDYYGHQKHDLMNDMEKTLDDANIQMDQDILVEVIGNGNGITDGGCMSSVQENGSNERDSGSLAVEPCRSSISVVEGLSMCKNISISCSSEISQSQQLASPSSELDGVHGTSTIATRGTPLGLNGLLNLGNTCFMNSAIQCLVHTPEFARYFREDYHKEINWKNPLGMVGELAMAFGDLLRKLWVPGRTSVSPRPFKTKLARFAPQFSGYNQHDSQELLAFLLDGLHEDLNRVKHRPYIKSKDADGRPDEVVADEYWANHIARNDSIIVDVCQGQYKSTLVCPVCLKVSVTFDPFMYLSLPLQSPSSNSMTIVVFTSDGSAPPTPCTVNVPKQGRCKDLIQVLSNACSMKGGEKLILAEIRDHKIHQFVEDPMIPLSNIKDEQLVAYKVPKFEKKSILLQFVHRREELEGNGSIKAWKPYGTPLMAPFLGDGSVRCADIRRTLQNMLIPMLQSQKSQPGCLSNSFSRVASYTTDHYISTDEECAESDHKDGGSNHDRSETDCHLFLELVDENDELIDLSTVEEKPLKLRSYSSSSSSTVVFINWSQKDLQIYDTRRLEILPEVYKYGPPLPKRSRGEPLSLYACLDAFLREEPLVPEDMWFCPKCKEQRQASKKLDLWRLPEVLVIHLKRFSFSRSTKQKLETFVNFPIHDFDLTDYLANKGNSQRQTYELYALSNHYGSMASGHYTAHIKLFEENRWYNFDDSHVSSINEEEVKSAAAYVLFYRRVRTDNPSTSNGAQSCANQSHSFCHR